MSSLKNRKNVNEAVLYTKQDIYRLLRLRLKSSFPEAKVIGFVSSSEEDGKTDVIKEIAISFVEAGDSVIVIDGYLRQDNYHDNPKNEHGLSQYLEGKCSIVGLIQKKQTYDTISNFTAVENSSALLETEQYKELILYLKERYDYVLIDTPSINSSIDSMIMGKCSDGVLYVLKSNNIREKEVKQHKEMFDEVGVKILGSILNEHKK